MSEKDEGAEPEATGSEATGSEPTDAEARAEQLDALVRSETDDPEGQDDFGDDAAAMTSLLGPERWVQFGFGALAFVIFYLVDKIIPEIARRVSGTELDTLTVSLVAGIVGLLGAFAAYRHPTSRRFADEVVSELSQVTWPSREETYWSTIVVIGTSLVAAIFTGSFDMVWSWLTDLVYVSNS